MDPLTLAAIAAGLDIFGGAAKSRGQSQAANAQISAQNSALAAQQKAFGQLQSLYAPGTSAYSQSLAALLNRAGLDGGAGGGGTGGAVDSAFEARNPDMAAEAGRLVANGTFTSPADYYAWHAQNYPDEARGGYAAPAASPNALKDPMAGLSPGTFGDLTNPSHGAPDYSAPSPFHYSLADYQASPAYQYQLDQGINAINSSQAAHGALASGATLKALQALGQNLAYQDFNNERQFAYGQYGADRDFSRNVYTSDRDYGRGVYDDNRDYLTSRYDKQTGDLSTIANYGQSAVDNTGKAILGQGQAGAAAALGIGAAKAGNAAAQGNIWGSTLNSISDLYNPKNSYLYSPKA